MQEIVVNLHMHTRYSDGSGSHKDIANAAIQTGLDAVIVTDHNVLVEGVESTDPSALIGLPLIQLAAMLRAEGVVIV